MDTIWSLYLSSRQNVLKDLLRCLKSKAVPITNETAQSDALHRILDTALDWKIFENLEYGGVWTARKRAEVWFLSVILILLLIFTLDNSPVYCCLRYFKFYNLPTIDTLSRYINDISLWQFNKYSHPYSLECEIKIPSIQVFLHNRMATKEVWKWPKSRLENYRHFV